MLYAIRQFSIPVLLVEGLWLLPFLLTGNARGIDAAGEQTGVLRAWMLSGREEPQPVGYLWIEMEGRAVVVLRVRDQSQPINGSAANLVVHHRSAAWDRLLARGARPSPE